MNGDLLTKLILEEYSDIEIDKKRFNRYIDSIVTLIGGYEIRTTRNSDEYETEIYKVTHRFDTPREPIFIKRSKSLEDAAKIHMLLENYINSLKEF